MNNKVLQPAPEKTDRPMFDWPICQDHLPFIQLSDGIGYFEVDLRNILFIARVPLEGVRMQFRSSPVGMNFANADQNYFDKLCELWRRANAPETPVKAVDPVNLVR